MDIKSYIEPSIIREFLIANINRIQGEIIIFEATRPKDTETIPVAEMVDEAYQLGRVHGKIEAESKLIGDLLKLVKE